MKHNMIKTWTQLSIKEVCRGNFPSNILYWIYETLIVMLEAEIMKESKCCFFWSKLFEGLGTIHLRNAGNVAMFCNIPPTALNNCLGSFAAVISTDSILYISPAASLSTFGKKTCELGHEYFLKIWQVRRMGVCKALGKTHFLKIF